MEDNAKKSYKRSYCKKGWVKCDNDDDFLPIADFDNEYLDYMYLSILFLFLSIIYKLQRSPDNFNEFWNIIL